MGTCARLYIGAILAGGVVCFAHAMAGWNCRHPLQYLCLLAVALPASTLKVLLPGAAGTISVSYVFVLLGMLDFSYPETVLLACLAMLVQCWWRARHNPKMLRVSFNLASTAIAVSLGFGTYHAMAGLGQVLVSVAAATTAYFLASTLSIAAVVALTESKNLPKVWRECYVWSFPYYLAGGAIAALISICNHRFGWETAVLALPVVYVVFRSYRLYLGRLEAEKNHAEEMANLHLRTIEALALAVEAKDLTTHDHLLRVQTYAVELGKKLHLDGSQLQALRTASILHDIGKLAVPEHIISKPGKLTAEEFEKMKIHPVVGAEILDRVQFPYDVVPIVRAHHERWNGSGYPYGLKGEEIPLGARILAAADCLDALASDRQYRRALPLDDAMAVVVAESGKGYEPRIVKILQENYQEWARLARSKEPQVNRLSKDVTIANGEAPAAGLQTSAAGDPEQPDARFSVAAAWQEAQTLYGLTREPGNSLNLHETLAVLDSRLRRLIPYDAIAVYVRHEDRLVPRYVSGENTRLFSALRIPVGQGLSGWVAATGKPMINGNPSVEPGYLNDPSKFSTLRSALAVPLENAAGVTGVLTLYHLGSDAFNHDHLRVLLALKPKVSLIVENALERARAAVSATTDPLTSLPDARALFQHLEGELARCRRTGSELAVLVGDLDGFRQVNDRFGYLEGNKVLKLVASGLNECCRQGEYVARMGGDEFALVLPGFKIEHLPKKLMALEEVAVESGLAVCGERLLNVSIGAVFYPEYGVDTEGLLAEAERRMYLAKRRLRIAAPSDSSALANLAARIEDSAACAPHSTLLQ
jgi:diguanylate cyclase (GGDEF)-like protein/putative nucleotidyltransferase with HDIG domain